MANRFLSLLLYGLALFLLAACGGAAEGEPAAPLPAAGPATATAVPPTKTATSAPPTSTTLLPTETAASAAGPAAEETALLAAAQPQFLEFYTEW